ncbi:MAG: Rho termination factor N-terminal domain-containing protein, partial [Flavobacteriaceae bacterium]|nr:Rho termination factor N-terminal domain-containing protein [Flavobacteriaceae bacterium]
MFEISQLKAKKLPELQDIAKQLNVPKYRTMKKLDLVYQILDHQAANPDAIKSKVETDSKPEQKHNKPQQRRERVQRNPKENNDQKSLEFSDKKEDSKPQEQKSNNDKQNQQRQDNKSNDRKDDNRRSNNNQKNDNRQNRNNNNNNSNNQKSNGNKDNRNRYREPDFEFDAIIESEGVLDIMQDGYGFLRSSDYNYLTSPD